MPAYRFAFVGVLVAMFVSNASALTTDDVWINEFHYDNTGADVGEFIEVAGLAGTDLSGLDIVFYNGATGDSYATLNLAGTLADESNGVGALSFAQAGIQNGSPDGFALVQGAQVIQFLSYEGTFTADNGPANGLLSTDVGVNEPGGTAVGSSLQLVGSGRSFDDFVFAGPGVESPGSLNAMQDIVASTSVKLLNETFDDDSQFSGSGQFFSDEDVSSGQDYFGIADGAGGGNFGADTPPSGLKAYIGNNGSFLAGQDLDGEGGPNPVQLDWTGINIAGFTDLQFSGSFAEFFDSPGDIDDNDFIHVEVQVDGGGFQDLLAFEGADFSTTANGIFREDTNFDGDGDGTALGNEFLQFVKDINLTGSQLDLRLIVNLGSGDEDFGADSFMITGERAGGGADVPEPTTLALLGLAGLAITRRRRNNVAA